LVGVVVTDVGVRVGVTGVLVGVLVTAAGEEARTLAGRCIAARAKSNAPTRIAIR
jgi:hypothetical protein